MKGELVISGPVGVKVGRVVLPCHENLWARDGTSAAVLDESGGSCEVGHKSGGR